MAGQSRTGRAGRRRFSLTALLLVALGVVLLLNTTGAVRPAIWLDLVRYWPVLLVLLGISMILGRRRPLVCAAVVALILAGTVFVAYMDTVQRENDDLLAFSYSAPVENTERLQLNIEVIGGTVNLTADRDGSETQPRLLSADFNGSPASVVQRRSDGMTWIDLTTDDLAVIGGAVRWDLAVSQDVAVSIDIKAGAADIDLDLRDLDVERLDIGAVASDIRVWLPADAGTTRVVISAGAVGIQLIVPDGVAARIITDGVLSSVEIDDDRFPDTGRMHGSPDYYASENRVSIYAGGVAIDLTVN